MNILMMIIGVCLLFTMGLFFVIEYRIDKLKRKIDEFEYLLDQSDFAHQREHEIKIGETCLDITKALELLYDYFELEVKKDGYRLTKRI